MKILLIEDDPRALEVEQRVLLDAGYEVDTTADPDDAVSRLKTIPYRGIVLDLAVAGVDADRIGNYDANSRTPVIIIGSGPDTRKRAFDAGAAAFLNKPFTAEAFRSVIVSSISPAGPGSGRATRPTRAARPVAPAAPVVPSRPAAAPAPPAAPSLPAAPSGPGAAPAPMPPAAPWRPVAPTRPAPRPAPLPLPRLTPSPAAAATEPARTPRATPGVEPLPVRTHDGLLYWSEPDPEGGWRCGRCETGTLASSAAGTTCSVCHAEVVRLEERRSGGLGWLLVLGLLGLGAGWAALTFWW